MSSELISSVALWFYLPALLWLAVSWWDRGPGENE